MTLSGAEAAAWATTDAGLGIHIDEYKRTVGTWAYPIIRQFRDLRYSRAPAATTAACSACASAATTSTTSPGRSKVASAVSASLNGAIT